MSVEQVEEAAVRVVSESGHVRGLEEITGVFDKGEVVLILACGVQVSRVPSLERKAGGQRYHLLQAAAKEIWHKQKDADGGDQGYKYRYPGGVSTKVCDDQAGGGRRGSNYKRDSRRQVTPPQHKSSRD